MTARHKLLWLLALVALLLTPLLIPSPVHAQEPITVTLNEHQVTFRERIIFRLEAESSDDITEAVIFLRTQGSRATRRGHPDFTPARRVELSYEWDMQERDYLPPGVEITYYWKLTDAAGHSLKTEPVSFVYEDDRFSWHTLSSDKLSLYWYRGDEDFGQALFQRAVESLAEMEKTIGVEVEQPIKIYIYGTQQDLLDAMAEGAREWTGGVTYDQVGVILIAISPGNLDWGLRAVVHELTHAVVGQAMQPPFGGLPTWLNEGLAYHAEGDMEPYDRQLLERAIRENKLISVRALNSSFPTDPNLAALSYAESYSLVDFILTEYGEETMSRLIEVFSRGAHYDDGLREVFGFDADGLEDAWREYIGAPPRLTVQEEATPTATPEVALPRPRGICCCGALPGIALLGLFLLFRPR